MSATSLLTRRRLLLGLIALVLAVAAVITVVALRSGADPAAGTTPSASPAASSGTDAGSDPEASESGAGGDEEPDDTPSGDDPTDAEPGGGADPAAREMLEPAPFGDEATPEPGLTVVVPKVEEVTGEANIPGEVGGPALRFTVDVTNGTGKTLDLRTVVVNVYYGPDRTPASPLLKPGGKAFDAEVGDGDTARGVFVFNVPAKFQDKVELEFDPRIDAPIAIFTGA